MYVNDDFGLFPLGKCAHRPIRPPRTNHVGEEVFSIEWQNLMKESGTDGDGVLCDILRAMPGQLTERQAAVAASFILWLGTNCGAALIPEGARLELAHGGFGRGYLAAWAVANARRPWLNNGARQIEAILAPDDHWRGGLLQTLPSLSAADYETIEHLVIWLADEGKDFIAKCEAEVSTRNGIAWRSRQPARRLRISQI